MGEGQIFEGLQGLRNNLRAMVAVGIDLDTKLTGLKPSDPSNKAPVPSDSIRNLVYECLELSGAVMKLMDGHHAVIGQNTQLAQAGSATNRAF